MTTKSSLWAVLSTSTVMLGMSMIGSQPSSAQDKFFCGLDVDINVPATFVRTSKGNIPIIHWVDDSFPPPFTAERRCEDISDRFQRFYDSGLLKMLGTGVINGQPVICSVDNMGQSCESDRILVTLKPYADAEATLRRLLDTRGRASGEPIRLGDPGYEQFIIEAESQTYFNLEGLLNSLEGNTPTSDDEDLW